MSSPTISTTTASAPGPSRSGEGHLVRIRDRARLHRLRTAGRLRAQRDGLVHPLRLLRRAAGRPRRGHPGQQRLLPAVHLRHPRGLDPQRPAACPRVAPAAWWASGSSTRCSGRSPRCSPPACPPPVTADLTGSPSASSDRTGNPCVLWDALAGAWGARPDRDGVDGISSLGANLTNTPVEELERSGHLRIDGYGYLPDSGGAGRWRGGLATFRDMTILAPEASRADQVRPKEVPALRSGRRCTGDALAQRARPRRARRTCTGVQTSLRDDGGSPAPACDRRRRRARQPLRAPSGERPRRRPRRQSHPGRSRTGTTAS